MEDNTIYQASDTPDVEIVAQGLAEASEEWLNTIRPGTDLELAPRTVVVRRASLDEIYLLTPRGIRIVKIPITQNFTYEAQLIQRNVVIKRSAVALLTVPSLQAGVRRVVVKRQDATLRFSFRKVILGSRQIRIRRIYALLDLVQTFVFPSLRPTSRNFTPPQHVNRKSTAQNGRQVRTLVAATSSNAALSLRYDNISNALAADIYTIYNAHGLSKPVTLPEDVFSGASGALKDYLQLVGSDLEWYFAEPPEIESVIKGVSTVSLTFAARRKVTLFYFPTVRTAAPVIDNSQSPVTTPVCSRPYGGPPGPLGPFELPPQEFPFSWSYMFTGMLAPTANGVPGITLPVVYEDWNEEYKTRLIYGTATTGYIAPALTNATDYGPTGELTLTQANVTEWVKGISNGIEAGFSFSNVGPIPNGHVLLVQYLHFDMNVGQICTAILDCPGMPTLREDGIARYGDVNPEYMVVTPNVYSGLTFQKGANVNPNTGLASGYGQIQLVGSGGNYISGSFYNKASGADGAQLAAAVIVPFSVLGAGTTNVPLYAVSWAIRLSFVPVEYAQSIPGIIVG